MRRSRRLANLARGNDERQSPPISKACKRKAFLGDVADIFSWPRRLSISAKCGDRISATFFEVTLGIGRLQAMMDRSTRPMACASTRIRSSPRGVDCVPPGETHSSAFAWSRNFSRRQLARHSGMGSPNRGQCARTVAGEWIGVVGVTLSMASRIEQAAKTIAAIPPRSINRNIGVMVGGQRFNKCRTRGTGWRRRGRV